MNNYIILDGKQYKTPASSWQPITNKPATVRNALDGSTDVTYGPTLFREWQGFIRASVSPASGYGAIADIRATLAKTVPVSFQDHYGEIVNVHVIGPFKVRSFTNVWDSSSNVIDFPVRLVEAK